MAVQLNNVGFTPTAGGTTDFTYSSTISGYQSPVAANAVTTLVYEYEARDTSGNWEIGRGACTITAGVPTFARTTVLYNSAGTGTMTPGQSGAGSKINFAAPPSVFVVLIKESHLATDDANSFSSAQRLQLAANLSMPPACGRLTLNNAASLIFKPFNGDFLKINGLIYRIPSNGIAGLGNTSIFVNGTGSSNLAASTFYYVYAFINAGVVTADFRTDGNAHLADTTAGNEGVEVRCSAGTTADSTRTLIGCCWTNASSQFTDIAVASWFNRRSKSAQVAQNFSSGAASSSVVFVSWGDEHIHIGTSGSGTNGTLNANGTLVQRVDGTSLGASVTGTTPVATATVPLTDQRDMNVTEASHTFDISYTLNAGTGTYVGESTIMIRG